jgi:glycosyltransferase involved in cell wall biosynthesis
VGAHGIGRFARELFGRLDGFQRIGVSGRPSAPIDPWRLSAYLRRVRPRLFFSPGYNAPTAAPVPFAFTVHDLNHLHVPSNSNALKRLYYTICVRQGVRNARVVFTVSEFSRGEICSWAGVGSDRVVSVGNGVSSAFGASGTVWSRTGNRPYFLHVGNYKPHKNFERVLRAFAASRLGPDFGLVATGAPPASVMALVEHLGLNGRVQFIGDVLDPELASVYRGATCLICVSLYEGFGLPLVEAMACGTPVLASTAASLPEIAGDAALLVDPLDIEAIASALARLASDSDLREELRRRGCERAKRFSWELTARKVQAALAACA